MPVHLIPGVDFASLTRLDLGISMLVPLGWNVTGDDSHIRLFGLAENSRRPTFTIMQGEPESEGAAWFASFRDEAVKRIASSATSFEEISVESFVLSSFVDVTALHYRRSDESGAVSQLQAYLWAGSTRMLIADAATGRDHESRDLPIFDAILKSLRLLPI